MSKTIDLEGQRFGRLTVIKDTDKRGGTNVTWLCKCDCGNLTNVRTCHLKSEHTRSCGCLKKEERLFTEEWKRKISESKKGKKRPSFSEEWKRKLGRSGENNGRWLGGISFEPYGIEFNKKLKEKIRKRHNYTCQMLDCNAIQNGKKFPIHHSDYNKKNNEDWNLVTLCHPCHSKTNTNREYWENYFKDKIA